MRRSILVVSVLIGWKVFSQGVSPEHIQQLERLMSFYGGVMDGELARIESVFEYASANNIPTNEVNKVALMIATQMQLDLEAGGGSALCMARMTEYMGWRPDVMFLPFLEKACLSTNRFVRRDALVGYIGVKKADSVEFVETRLSTGEYSVFDKRAVYRQMAEQIRFCDEKGKKKIIGFMLRQTQTIEDSYLRDNLEQILLPNLPEYRHSIQREHFARRLQNSTNDLVRGRAEQIINEIKKVPVLQRKDLSDLLRKPADETKGE